MQEERYGLLGKGAILLVTSHATRTSPVIRGKWILENIIGTPPPPPPPDVPALPDPAAGVPTTMRERVEAHRRAATCAACHRLLDPLGFALEPLDAVGRLRTRDHGAPIDASGRLMDGTPVTGPASLRAALARNPDVFVRTITEKLMIYALGRGLEPADLAYLRTIAREARPGRYRFSTIVSGIVRSVPFQMKVVSPAATSAERSTALAR
jgi:hypothetical protein